MHQYNQQSRIAILYGGFSHERDISLRSGQNAYDILRAYFENIELVDVTHDLAWCEQIRDADFVFNMLHGDYGEDGRVQSVLDMLSKKHNTSGVTTSSLCFDKHLCTAVLKAGGIKSLHFPSDIVVNADDLRSLNILDIRFSHASHNNPKPPYIIKPSNSGSSFGVCIINDNKDIERCAKEWQFGKHAIIQEFVQGIEVTSSVVTNKFIGAAHIDYSSCSFFDYDQKYTIPYRKTNLRDHKIYSRLEDVSLRIYDVLDCKGMVRIDFIYNEECDMLYFLEVNTQPGFSSQSIVPALAEQNGYTSLEILKMQMV